MTGFIRGELNIISGRNVTYIFLDLSPDERSLNLPVQPSGRQSMKLPFVEPVSGKWRDEFQDHPSNVTDWDIKDKCRVTYGTYFNIFYKQKKVRL